ncbi:hypothetical protein KI387_037811, partial [Taxus chinensis]
VVVDEAREIEWCDNNFLPHSPCVVERGVEEETNDDETDDYECMMDSSTISE